MLKLYVVRYAGVVAASVCTAGIGYTVLHRALIGEAGVLGSAVLDAAAIRAAVIVGAVHDPAIITAMWNRSMARAMEKPSGTARVDVIYKTASVQHS